MHCIDLNYRMLLGKSEVYVLNIKDPTQVLCSADIAWVWIVAVT